MKKWKKILYINWGITLIIMCCCIFLMAYNLDISRNMGTGAWSFNTKAVTWIINGLYCSVIITALIWVITFIVWITIHHAKGFIEWLKT